MPARMIRETLLASDRFLSLPDNTARICFVVAMLNVDDRGNMEASGGQLVRLWRDFGVDSNQKATAIAQFLADQDLIRLYDSGGKQYMHIPRFGQRKRHLVHACPASPWCESEGNQQSDHENVGRASDERLTVDGRPSAEVKRSEEKKYLAQGFARFWDAYPKRVSKGRAERAFTSLKPSEQLLASILLALERAKTSVQWQRESGRFIPYPATWLNAKGWEDELPETVSSDYTAGAR